MCARVTQTVCEAQRITEPKLKTQRLQTQFLKLKNLQEYQIKKLYLGIPSIYISSKGNRYGSLKTFDKNLFSMTNRTCTEQKQRK